MANFILQELPEGMTDGKKVLYPKMQTYNLHDFDTVVKHMNEYAGTFSKGTIRGVIDALITTMKSWMPLGHTIKIDGLGVFSLKLGFDNDIPAEKYNHICIKGINFKPDPKLLAEMNKEACFDRVMSEIRKPQKNEHSLEERLAKAKEIIGQNGFMTLSDYARATGLSRTAASVELKAIVANPAFGITTRGSHSHKVWVRK